ncbi:MAG: Holliday junction resolvase RuvX [Salinibacterium sp.]|nr:Holliday junction resolvase RuvX [Salinibacterium sp.]
MRSGNRLAIDVGTARIGVARSDREGLLATPVETVPRALGDLERIAQLIDEFAAVEVIVGLPIALSGRETPSTTDARSFALEIARLRPIPVRLVDERLSTVSAQSAMRASGRTVKSSRSVIDQVAAVIILQNALDFERSAAKPPGVLVDPDEGLH